MSFIRQQSLSKTIAESKLAWQSFGVRLSVTAGDLTQHVTSLEEQIGRLGASGLALAGGGYANPRPHLANNPSNGQNWSCAFAGGSSREYSRIRQLGEPFRDHFSKERLRRGRALHRSVR